MSHPTPLAQLQRLADRVAGGAVTPPACTERVPVADYVDQAHFERQRQRIFRRRPLVLCHASQIPGAGDVIVHDWLGLPLVTVRDRSGEVGPFFEDALAESDTIGDHRRSAVARRETAEAVQVAVIVAEAVPDDSRALDDTAGLVFVGRADAAVHLYARRNFLQARAATTCHRPAAPPAAILTALFQPDIRSKPCREAAATSPSPPPWQPSTREPTASRNWWSPPATTPAPST